MVNALLAGIIAAEEARKAGTADADVLTVAATVRPNAAAVVIGNFSLKKSQSSTLAGDWLLFNAGLHGLVRCRSTAGE